MMADKHIVGGRLIDLSAKRLERGVLCEQAGIRFPVVHRVIGRWWKPLDKHGQPIPEDVISSDVGFDFHELVPGDLAPEPLYVLGNDASGCGLAEPQAAPIDRPDPLLDQGKIIIVRHHRSLERAEGYIDGTSHGYGLFPDAHQMLWTTSFGVFTLTWRPPVEGQPSPRLVYIADVQAVISNLGGVPLKNPRVIWDIWKLEVGPDGPLGGDEDP